MKTVSKEDLKALHKLSFKNREQLSNEEKLCCFYCKSYFQFADIEEWADGQLTALCPECSIDSVIPYVDKQILNTMYHEYFEKATKYVNGIRVRVELIDGKWVEIEE